jgi:hypothetical protein
MPQPGYKKRLFLILWIAGMAGVLSFLLVDLSAIIASMPKPPGAPVELPPPMLLKIASIIQPAVLTSLAVLVGVLLAERVNLHAPAAEAWAKGGDLLAGLKPQIIPGIIAGLASGVAIVLAWLIAKPFLPAQFLAHAQDFNQFLPAPTRFLYGGFTEELLLRWGVMTFLVWAAWRLFGRAGAPPRPIFYIAAILVSSLLFGIGHLPIASMLGGGLTASVVAYVVTANSIFGIVAGTLFWKKGLESAIIAHISAHIILISAIYLAV